MCTTKDGKWLTPPNPDFMKRQYSHWAETAFASWLRTAIITQAAILAAYNMHNQNQFLLLLSLVPCATMIIAWAIYIERERRLFSDMEIVKLAEIENTVFVLNTVAAVGLLIVFGVIVMGRFGRVATS